MPTNKKAARYIKNQPSTKKKKENKSYKDILKAQNVISNIHKNNFLINIPSNNKMVSVFFLILLGCAMTNGDTFNIAAMQDNGPVLHIDDGLTVIPGTHADEITTVCFEGKSFPKPVAYRLYDVNGKDGISETLGFFAKNMHCDFKKEGQATYSEMEKCFEKGIGGQAILPDGRTIPLAERVENYEKECVKPRNGFKN